MTNKDDERITHYRTQAKALRELAKTASTAQAQNELAELAVKYDQLAAQLQREKDPPAKAPDPPPKR